MPTTATTIARNSQPTILCLSIKFPPQETSREVQFNNFLTVGNLSSYQLSTSETCVHKSCRTKWSSILWNEYRWKRPPGLYWLTFTYTNGCMSAERSWTVVRVGTGSMGHLKTTSAVLVGSHTVKNKALGFDMHIYCSTISIEELRPSTDGSAVCTRLSCRQPACLQPKAAACLRQLQHGTDRQMDGSWYRLMPSYYNGIINGRDKKHLKWL